MKIFSALIMKDAILYVNKSRFEKFLNNKTLNLSTGNKVQFPETIDKLGFDRIIHQSRNLVNVNNSKSEPVFIDDYDDEISDFDKYAENYEHPRNKVYANIKMYESVKPSEFATQTHPHLHKQYCH